MKTLISILIGLWGVGCGKEPVKELTKEDQSPSSVVPESPRLAQGEMLFKNLEQRRDRLAYLKDSSVPFTGTALDFHPNGLKSLKVEVENGREHGVLLRWDAQGQLVLRQFWESGRLIEVLDGEQARKAEAHFAERKKLDQTVWQGEVRAQEYEDTFVRLWDDLRAAKNPLEVLEKFDMGKISLPESKKTTERDWGIRVDQYAKGDKEMSAADWHAKLAALREDGVTITETEWHQMQFEPAGPRSRFSFVIHAARAKTRYIVRGEMTVEWSERKDVRNLFQPASIAVTQFNLLQRTGPLAFKEELLIDSAAQTSNTDANAAGRSRVREVHPILSYDLDRDGRQEIIAAGANLVYWNLGDGKWRIGPLCIEDCLPLPATGCLYYTRAMRMSPAGKAHSINRHARFP
jgi:hypothetical protein